VANCNNHSSAESKYQVKLMTPFTRTVKMTNSSCMQLFLPVPNRIQKMHCFHVHLFIKYQAKEKFKHITDSSIIPFIDTLSLSL